MPSKARRSVLVVFWLLGFVTANWLARIPAVQQQLHASTGALGSTLLAAALGSLIAMPLAGQWSARFGSRRVTLLALPAFCLSLPLLAFAPNLPTLFAALLYMGATSGALDIGMNAQAIAVEEAYGRPLMSSFHAAFSFGGMSGAAAGGFLAKAGAGLHLHFLVAAVVALLIGALSARSLLAHSAHEGGSHTFALPRGPLLLLGLLAVFDLLAEGSMADWSALYMSRLPHVSEAEAASGYACFSLAMAFGRLCGDALHHRYGPVRLVRVGALVATAGLTIALLTSRPTVTLLGFTAVGAGLSIVIPLVFTAAGRTPGVAPGIGLAAVTTMGWLGFLAGPPLIGKMADYLGLRGALWLVVVLIALLLPLAGTVAVPSNDPVDPHS